MNLAGICSTDLALVRGYMGFEGIPGHEFVGVALDGPLAGRRVVGEINAGCGSCALCQSGDPRHCTGRSVLGIVGRSGAFAEELTLPAENLLAVPDTLSDEQAVFTEPLAAAAALLEATPLEGREVTVLGDGRLGLLCAMVAQAHGASVRLIGRHPERARLLGEAPEVEAGPPASAEVVVEATGHPEGLHQALALVRPRGTIVMKSTYPEAVRLDLSQLVVDEVRLIGSRCGRFRVALDLLANGTIDPTPMIEQRVELAQGPDALARVARGGVLKILLQIGA